MCNPAWFARLELYKQQRTETVRQLMLEALAVRGARGAGAIMRSVLTSNGNQTSKRAALGWVWKTRDHASLPALVKAFPTFEAQGRSGDPAPVLVALAEKGTQKEITHDSPGKIALRVLARSPLPLADLETRKPSLPAAGVTSPSYVGTTLPDTSGDGLGSRRSLAGRT